MSAGVAVNATLARWFLHRRAWAMAMSSTGVSLGGAILSPVNAVLIETWGLNVATPVMGALILVVGIPIVAFVLVWDPRQMGLPQDGFDPPPDAPSEGARSLANQTRQWTMRQATGTPAFWAIMGGFRDCAAGADGVPAAPAGVSDGASGSLTAATFTLSLTAIGSIVARLIVGRFFADRVDLRVLTVIMFVVQGAAGLVLVFIDSTITTWIAVLVFGFTIGNVYMLQSLLTVGRVRIRQFRSGLWADRDGDADFQRGGTVADRSASRCDGGVHDPVGGGVDFDLRGVAADLFRAPAATARAGCCSRAGRDCAGRAAASWQWVQRRAQPRTNSIWAQAVRRAASTCAGSDPRAKMKPG